MACIRRGYQEGDIIFYSLLKTHGEDVDGSLLFGLHTLKLKGPSYWEGHYWEILP